jgi:hypothetical protein
MLQRALRITPHTRLDDALTTLALRKSDSKIARA